MDPQYGEVTRRAFLTTGLRCAALTGLAALGGVLTLRTARSNQACIGDGVCRTCSSLSGCGLPQAASTRQVIHPRVERPGEGA